MSHGVIKDNVYFKQEKEKDRLRMGGGSWSINLDELDTTSVRAIVFCSELGHYIITIEDALAHGFERTLGGEHKLVVPVKCWRFNESSRKT